MESVHRKIVKCELTNISMDLDGTFCKCGEQLAESYFVENKRLV